jgi:hypothetical protein
VGRSNRGSKADLPKTLPAACIRSDLLEIARLGTGGRNAVKYANELGTKNQSVQVEPPQRTEIDYEEFQDGIRGGI